MFLRSLKPLSKRKDDLQNRFTSKSSNNLYIISVQFRYIYRIFNRNFKDNLKYFNFVEILF